MLIDPIVVLDKRVNEYVGPGLGTTPYLMFANYYNTPEEAVAWLTKNGFANVVTTGFEIRKSSRMPFTTIGGTTWQTK